MYPVLAVLKDLALPPLNLVVLALLGWGIGRRWPQLGRALVSLALCSLYFLATPYGCFLLARSLQTAPVLTPDRWEKAAGAIVVLGGGIYEYAPEYGGETVGRSTLERLRYGARLARELQLPLLVSGGSLSQTTRPVAELMQEALVHDFQVPVQWLEPASRNTYENARFSAKLLRDQGIHTVYLVTHAWHMPRSQAAFAAFGMTTIPAPTYFITLRHVDVNDLLPQAYALTISHDALYEWIGRLWYAMYYY